MPKSLTKSEYDFLCQQLLKRVEDIGRLFLLTIKPPPVVVIETHQLIRLIEKIMGDDSPDFLDFHTKLNSRYCRSITSKLKSEDDGKRSL